MMLALLGAALLGTVTGSVGADSRPLHGTLDRDTMVFKTADGTICTAELEKLTSKGGLGSVNCADGRSGSFGWTFLGKDRATGDGWLGGESLTLIFEVENRTQF